MRTEVSELRSLCLPIEATFTPRADLVQISALKTLPSLLVAYLTYLKRSSSKSSGSRTQKTSFDWMANPLRTAFLVSWSNQLNGLVGHMKTMKTMKISELSI